MRLGNVKDFSKEVNEISINGEKFFLVNINNRFTLFDSICPHQGARLSFNSETNTIQCPVHGWEFEVGSGCSTNVKSKSLFEKKIKVTEDGDIYLVSITLEKDFNKSNNYNKIPKFEIHLHAHAALEFRTERFSLLCDPWIEGNAFLGAWKHYPEPIISIDELNPDAIWISHEHSDHFHEESLKKFKKTIPVYIPAFVNERLEKRLDNLGFENINVVPFGYPIEIAPNFIITIYEPASMWNDAQVLIEIENFRILNINDSGINHRIAKKIGQVDVIASAFSPGASGYPLTWQHISDLRKISIMKEAKKSILDMLVQATKMYSAKYFLPFAGHFILGYPEHIKYMELMQKNTVDDVKNRFNDENCEVLDLLAGDYWIANESKMVKINRNREELYHPKVINEYIKSSFEEQKFNKYYPSKKQYKFDKEIIYKYFKDLNSIPEMKFCEDLTMSVHTGFIDENAFSFEVKNGKLRISDSLIVNANLTMKISSEILMYICVQNESWDEAIIGYWCEFSRNPDVYHAEFWRILQTPYYLKSNNIIFEKESNSKINKDSNIAEVLELLKENGSKIIGRYGLYCMSCNKATMESIEIASKMHGIDNQSMTRMIDELNIHLQHLKEVAL